MQNIGNDKHMSHENVTNKVVNYIFVAHIFFLTSLMQNIVNNKYTGDKNVSDNYISVKK